MPDDGWIIVRKPETDRIIEAAFTCQIRDLQGDLIPLSVFQRNMEIGDRIIDAPLIYKHARDKNMGVIQLAPHMVAYKFDDRKGYARYAVRKGNRIVDAIWENEMVPMGTRAGFSIGGIAPHTAKSCKKDKNGRQSCDVSDVIHCENSWTPGPANPEARVTYVACVKEDDSMEKAEEKSDTCPDCEGAGGEWEREQNSTNREGHCKTCRGSGKVTRKQVGAAIAAISTIASVAGSGGGSDNTVRGPKGKVGDEEEKDMEKGTVLVPQSRTEDAETHRNRVDEVRHREQQAGKDPDDVVGSSGGHGGTKRYTKEEEIKMKAYEAELENRLIAIHKAIDKPVDAWTAVTGCGTCDDYVSLQVRKGSSTTQGILRLQSVIDKAQKKEPEDAEEDDDDKGDKKMPKEEKTVVPPEEGMKKALDEMRETIVKELQAYFTEYMKKEFGHETKIGAGTGPLAGVPSAGQGDPTVMNSMSTSKSVEEMVKELVAAGYIVQKVKAVQPNLGVPTGKNTPSGTGIQKEAHQHPEIARLKKTLGVN